MLFDRGFFGYYSGFSRSKKLSGRDILKLKFVSEVDIMHKESEISKGKGQVIGGKQVRVADPKKVKKAAQENIIKYQSVLEELKYR